MSDINLSQTRQFGNAQQLMDWLESNFYPIDRRATGFVGGNVLTVRVMLDTDADGNTFFDLAFSVDD